MIRPRYYFKIRKPIIGPYVIFMMDSLVWLQQSTYIFFNNQSMFANPILSNLAMSLDIAIFVNPKSVFVSWMIWSKLPTIFKHSIAAMRTGMSH